MNGRALLDTNVVIDLFANRPAVRQRLTEIQEVFISSIALGELYFGAYRSMRLNENLALIDEFIANNVVLGCDTETARRYGEIKNELRNKGRPIPENDIWIAAIALQHDLTLITRDAHFEEIVDLKKESW
jgi:tRNA(fMet)-specific endonuclease VapC